MIEQLGEYCHKKTNISTTFIYQTDKQIELYSCVSAPSTP